MVKPSKPILEGSLKDIHLGGMLRLLCLHGFTGVLEMENQNEKGEIYLENGRIIGAWTPAEPLLGEILLEEKIITKKILDQVLQEQKKDSSPRKIGEYLVESHGISPAAVERVLQEQAARRVIALLSWKEGRFHYRETTDFPRLFIRLQKSTENLLLEAFRKMSPKEAETHLPPHSALLEWAPRPKNQDLDIYLEADEWNLLALFDGNRSIAECWALSGQEKGKATVRTHALLSSGLLKKVRFKFPDLEHLAEQALGQMGIALVQQAYKSVGIHRSKMGMRELLKILNHLEKSMTLLIGPGRTQDIIERMWEAVKR